MGFGRYNQCIKAFVSVNMLSLEGIVSMLWDSLRSMYLSIYICTAHTVRFYRDVFNLMYVMKWLEWAAINAMELDVFKLVLYFLLIQLQAR